MAEITDIGAGSPVVTRAQSGGLVLQRGERGGQLLPCSSVGEGSWDEVHPGDRGAGVGAVRADPARGSRAAALAV